MWAAAAPAVGGTENDTVVQIYECVDGYARVNALRAPVYPGEEEGEQVFLKSTNGGWTLLTSGSGITCAEQDFARAPELRRACNALGLAQ